MLLENFLANIRDDENLVIEKFPNRILFCGGPCLEQGSSSFRYYYLEKNKLGNFIIPERIREWNQYDIYDNLVDFEEDLASVCCKVIIPLESAGSISELSVLCQKKELINRLFVILDEDHDGDSFIRLGPLKLLEKEDDDIVCVSPLIPKMYCEDDFYENIYDEVSRKIENKKNNICPFVKENLGHVSLLLYQVSTYVGIITFKDAQAICSRFSIDLNKNMFERCKLILQACELATTQKYMTTKYTFPIENINCIRFPFKKNISNISYFVEHRDLLSPDAAKAIRHFNLER